MTNPLQEPVADDADATPVVLAGQRDAIVDDGAVEVVVAFPPITLSAAEAEALRAGQVLELKGRLAEMALSVQLGGRQVAVGHLVVLIEDGAGVMLSHLRT